MSRSWELYRFPVEEPSESNSAHLPGSYKTEPWIRIDLPRNLKKELEPGNGWVLLRKRFTETDVSGSASVSRTLCLGKISDRTRVFWNGKEVGEEFFSAYAAETPQGYDRHRMYSIPPETILRENEIRIYLKPYFEYEFGILSGEIVYGPSAQIWKRWVRSEIAGLLTFASFCLIGIFFLFVFAQEKKGKENLYFGIFLISFSLYQISLCEFKYFTGIKMIYLKKFEYSFLVLLFPTFCAFLESFFFSVPKKGLRRFRRPIGGKKRDLAASLPEVFRPETRLRFRRILECSSFVFALLFVFAPDVDFLDRVNRNGLQTTWIGYALLSFWIVLPSAPKDRDAKRILCGILCLISFVIVDVLAERGNFRSFRISGMGVVCFLFFLCLTLANRFVQMRAKLDSWNAVLEKGIAARTEELTQSVQKIKTLKEQQDGDYFLITLLFRPFLSSDLETPEGKIETHRKQYKRFQFKKKEYEIGGDVAFCETVLISGIPYRVVINADAMGKSIQGASGALIFCSIVKSFLQTPDYPDRSPENWLFLLYKNLQAVFQSLDGSMFVSAVLALVRFETGDFFYLNCEHPPLLLVRNGSVFPLSTEEILPKLGFPVSETSLKLKIHYQILEDGDTILLGSDGREDLYLPVEQSSEKRKTSAPEIFLEVAASAPNTLSELEERLLQKGELSDDLSFMRIRTKSTAQREILRKKISTLVREGKRALQEGKEEEACSWIVQACLLHPSDLNLLRIALKTAYRVQNKKRIRLLSEKFILRTSGYSLAAISNPSAWEKKERSEIWEKRPPREIQKKGA
ncbi:stage II sporulation protein E [Leptospira gomenensis]|uniref:Stage II sporulation protein E n=1 Tax=Leptospira gomenensis TaxID=2484974 RepID=A0A5F1YSU7_9LEPT|nr:SpoIIE family protein phosphatase [Leptospira gomenensis]TGK35105.1 stage II sporulation protein E [Leptospira gomenensis]TGK35218.1 stage II sporulation protein E [Leptospira gomenensis]TGK41079.1 stage II sporulation protein E [Leptospira gomenensis]TGK61309.1 stage II sporulation protein E [Leptospira gomenensis]